jgi:hypothetical protein
MYRHDDCMCKAQNDNMIESKKDHMYKTKEYARAYILPQKYENLYSCKEGFLKGTIFVDLYKPYHDYKKMKCER